MIGAWRTPVFLACMWSTGPQGTKACYIICSSIDADKDITPWPGHGTCFF
jgi:hypothetical protein